MTDKANVPLHERYRLAVVEFRAAYAQLAAHDLRYGLHGFGEPPDVATHLRHAIANPHEGGSFADDVQRALRIKPPELIAAEEADKKDAGRAMFGAISK
jgi:hypothetical protein